jgi:hypothetical protein
MNDAVALIFFPQRNYQRFAAEFSLKFGNGGPILKIL